MFTKSLRKGKIMSERFTEDGLENGFSYNIVRYNNPFPNSSDELNNYIIEIQFINNIGIVVYSCRINGNDILNILDNFTLFLCGLCFNTSEINVKLQPHNNKIPIIELSNLYKDNLSISPRLHEYRCYQLSIYEADMNNQNHIIQILKIAMGETEINDFLFNLYFNCLSDIILPTDTLNKLDEYVGRVFGSNWFNYG